MTDSPKTAQTARQSGQKVALVTGASRGIGYHIALQLARSGIHVIALARTQGGLEALDEAIGAHGDGGSATLVPLDLTDYDGLDRLGSVIFERWGRLDILAANAGILGPLSPLAHVEPAVFEQVLATNLTANWRLLRSVEPLLRRAQAARIVIMTSTAARKCKAYWGPYSISKAALEALARSWANEVTNTGMRINLVNPGATRTAMRALAMPGEDPQTLPDAHSVARAMIPLFSPECDANGELFDVLDGRLSVVATQHPHRTGGSLTEEDTQDPTPASQGARS